MKGGDKIKSVEVFLLEEIAYHFHKSVGGEGGIAKYPENMYHNRDSIGTMQLTQWSLVKDGQNRWDFTMYVLEVDEQM